MTRLRNKKQAIMEKMLALLWLGKGGRDPLYGELIHKQEVVPEEEHMPGSSQRKKGKK